MLVRAFGASAERIRSTRRPRRGIPMEAAQTNVYHARLYRVPVLRGRLDCQQPTHSPRSPGRRCPLQRFQSTPGAQRLRDRGRARGKYARREETTLRSSSICERRRAIPKAPHNPAAKSCAVKTRIQKDRHWRMGRKTAAECLDIAPR